MTTTGRRFTTQDVVIGVDCGIEWGTPIGAVRFEEVGGFIVCNIEDSMAFTVILHGNANAGHDTAVQINRIINDRTYGGVANVVR